MIGLRSRPRFATLITVVLAAPFVDGGGRPAAAAAAGAEDQVVALSGWTIRVTDVNGGVVIGILQGTSADQPLIAQLPMCIAQ